MTIAYLLFIYQAALNQAVLSIIEGIIKIQPVLLLLATLMVILAGVLTLIPGTVNPPAPPYSVSLLFRQVRIALGITATVNEIDMKYEIKKNTQNVEVGNLLPLELWI